MFTFGIFKQNVCVYDPLFVEEQAMKGRISIAINIYKEICNMHKPGGIPIDYEIMTRYLFILMIV